MDGYKLAAWQITNLEIECREVAREFEKYHIAFRGLFDDVANIIENPDVVNPALDAEEACEDWMTDALNNDKTDSPIDSRVEVLATALCALCEPIREHIRLETSKGLGDGWPRNQHDIALYVCNFAQINNCTIRDAIRYIREGLDESYDGYDEIVTIRAFVKTRAKHVADGVDMYWRSIASQAKPSVIAKSKSRAKSKIPKPVAIPNGW